MSFSCFKYLLNVQNFSYLFIFLIFRINRVTSTSLISTLPIQHPYPHQTMDLMSRHKQKQEINNRKVKIRKANPKTEIPKTENPKMEKQKKTKKTKTEKQKMEKIKNRKIKNGKV